MKKEQEAVRELEKREKSQTYNTPVEVESLQEKKNMHVKEAFASLSDIDLSLRKKSGPNAKS